MLGAGPPGAPALAAQLSTPAQAHAQDAADAAREAHPTTATKALRRRLEADAAAAISARLYVEASRRERTQLDRAALLQQQVRRRACSARKRACWEVNRRAVGARVPVGVTRSCDAR